jgi:hypothetical protein
MHFTLEVTEGHRRPEPMTRNQLGLIQEAIWVYPSFQGGVENEILETLINEFGVIKP